MRKTIFNILSLSTGVVSGVWIGYILWAETIGGSYWEISPSEEGSVLKFLAILIPSFFLALFTIFIKESSYTDEKNAISEENKILQEKIKREELKQRLDHLKNKKDELG